MIYVVLGMHKSGTTLISRILHESNIDMGEFDKSISYDKGNQYERHITKQINKTMLGCGNTHSLDVIHTMDSSSFNRDDIDTKIREFVCGMESSHTDWGFKDPRTCLTYSKWQQHLPVHKVIYVYRPPIEVWHHFRKYIPAYKIIERRIQEFKALRAWYVHNNQLLKFIKESKRDHLIVNFSMFMKSTSSLKDLESFVGRPLVDCRKIELYRSTPKVNLSFRLGAALLSLPTGCQVTSLYEKLEEERQNL